MMVGFLFLPLKPFWKNLKRNLSQVVNGAFAQHKKKMKISESRRFCNENSILIDFDYTFIDAITMMVCVINIFVSGSK